MRHTVKKGERPLLVVDGKVMRWDDLLLKTPTVALGDFERGFTNHTAEVYVTRDRVESKFTPKPFDGMQISHRKSGRPLICVTTEQQASG